MRRWCCGIEAGTSDPDGNYPEGTVHGLVDRELQRLAKGLKGFDAEDKEDKKDKGSGPAAA